MKATAISQRGSQVRVSVLWLPTNVVTTRDVDPRALRVWTREDDRTWAAARARSVTKREAELTDAARRRK